MRFQGFYLCVSLLLCHIHFHSSPHHLLTWLASKGWAWGASACRGHSRRWCQRRSVALKVRTLPSLHSRASSWGPETASGKKQNHISCVSPFRWRKAVKAISWGATPLDIKKWTRTAVAPTKSCLTKSLALGKNFSGNSYSSFIIFWKIRYSLLRRIKHVERKKKNKIKLAQEVHLDFRPEFC